MNLPTPPHLLPPSSFILHPSSFSGAAPPRIFTFRLPPANSISSSAASMCGICSFTPPPLLACTKYWAEHEFLNEGGAAVARLLHQHPRNLVTHRKVPRIKPDQLEPAFVIRQRELDRLLDASGTRGERRFQILG